MTTFLTIIIFLVVLALVAPLMLIGAAILVFIFFLVDGLFFILSYYRWSADKLRIINRIIAVLLVMLAIWVNTRLLVHFAELYKIIEVYVIKYLS